MLTMGAEQLAEGDVLAADLYYPGGILYLKGTKLGLTDIAMIRKYGCAVGKICVQERRNVKRMGIEAKMVQALKEGRFEKAAVLSRELIEEFKNEDGLGFLKRINEYDDGTYNHSISVGALSGLIALVSGMDTEKAEEVALSGLLHDVGKLSVPHEIISAPRKLTDIEYAQVKSHPLSGYRFLCEHRCACITDTVMQVVRQHHENEDGSGYPGALKHSQICPAARVVHLADVFDALTSVRPYRPMALSLERTLDYINGLRGKMFDPFYAEILTKIMT